MNFPHLSKRQFKESLKAAGLVVVFSACLIVLYAAVLFTHFEKTHQHLYKHELERISLIANQRTHDMITQLHHLDWRLSRQAAVTSVVLEEFITEKVAQDLQVIWSSDTGDTLHVSTGQQEKLLTQEIQGFPQKIPLTTWRRWALFQHRLDIPEKGLLILKTPLKALAPSSLFTPLRTVPESAFEKHPSLYKIPLHHVKSVLLLKPASPLILSLYWKEHAFPLLFFALFSIGTSFFVVVHGKRSYRRALVFLKETIEATHQKSLQVEKAFSQEQVKNRFLEQQNTLSTHATKQREAFMCEVLARQRLMREKAYLHMAVFEREEDFEEEDKLKLWIQDMRNHFGLPQVQPFRLRDAFEQVIAVFTQEIEQKRIQLHIKDQIDTDLLESDRLILSIIIANILNTCIARLPQEGILSITLARTKRGFTFQVLDDGYMVDFPASPSRQKFFFLEEDVLKDVCASLHLKLTRKKKIEGKPHSLNSTLLYVPLKIKNAAREPGNELLSLPTNVLQFPRKKKASHEWSEVT